MAEGDRLLHEEGRRDLLGRAILTALLGCQLIRHRPGDGGDRRRVSVGRTAGRARGAGGPGLPQRRHQLSHAATRREPPRGGASGAPPGGGPAPQTRGGGALSVPAQKRNIHFTNSAFTFASAPCTPWSSPRNSPRSSAIPLRNSARSPASSPWTSARSSASSRRSSLPSSASRCSSFASNRAKLSSFSSLRSARYVASTLLNHSTSSLATSSPSLS